MDINDLRGTIRMSFVKFSDSNIPDIVQLENPTPEFLNRYYDESYIHIIEQKQVKSIRQKLLNKMVNFLDRVPLIAPESTSLLLWNLIVVIAILFNLYEIPIAIFLTEQVYQSEFETTAGIAINSVFIVVLFIDIFLVRPNISFYKAGKIVISHRQILRRYLFLEFEFDLISWIVLVIYAALGNSNVIYAKIIFYLYLLTLSRIDDQISSKIQLLRLRYAAYKLFKIIFILLFITLWLSCIYFSIDYSYYVEQNQYYPVNLWLTNSVCSQYQGAEKFINLVQMYSWYVWLNYAYYWTLQSISMVGYGDMTPRNPPQVAYCDVVVLLMTLMYAFFINSVWQIIAEASELENLEENNQKNLMKYRKIYNIKGKMINKLGSYMHQMWKTGKSEEIQEQINNSLTEDLRNDLLLAKQKKFFWGIPLFDSLATYSQDNTELFREWAYLIKEKRYGQDQTVFKADDIADRIYSIIIGEVKLGYAKSYVSCKCFQNTTFGQYKFFVQEQYGYSCTTLKFNKISFLTKQGFLNSLKHYQNTYEKYREVIENIKIYQQIEHSGEQCWICSSNDHQAMQCPEFFSLEKQIRENFIIRVRKQRGQYERQKKQVNQRHMKAMRKYVPRRNLPSERIIQRMPPFTSKEVDCVKFFKHYRYDSNIS